MNDVKFFFAGREYSNVQFEDCQVTCSNPRATQETLLELASRSEGGLA